MRRSLRLALLVVLFSPPGRAFCLTKLEGLRLFDRIAAKLELEPQQRSEIFFLLVRNQKEIRRLLSDEESARSALREAIARPELDEELVRDRSCRVAEAELAVSLAAARLYAEVSEKLTLRQRETVRAWAGSLPVRSALVAAAAEAAGAGDLFLTLR